MTSFSCKHTSQALLPGLYRLHSSRNSHSTSVFHLPDESSKCCCTWCLCVSIMGVVALVEVLSGSHIFLHHSHLCGRCGPVYVVRVHHTIALSKGIEPFLTSGSCTPFWESVLCWCSGALAHYELTWWLPSSWWNCRIAWQCACWTIHNSQH